MPPNSAYTLQYSHLYFPLSTTVKGGTTPVPKKVGRRVKCGQKQNATCIQLNTLQKQYKVVKLINLIIVFKYTLSEFDACNMSQKKTLRQEDIYRCDFCLIYNFSSLTVRDLC